MISALKAQFWRGWVARVFALSALAISCTKGKDVSFKPEEVRKECVGRFCLNVPKTMVRTKQGYQIQKATLLEEDFPKHSDRPFEDLWQQHLVAIGELKKKRANADDVMGEVVENWVLEADKINGVIYHQNWPHRITVAMLANEGTHAFWVNAQDVIEYRDKAKTRARKIAEAYRPDTEAQTGRDWFYLARGAVALPFELQEKAEASFGQYPGLEFEIEMTTTNQARPGLIERIMTSLSDLGSRMVQPISIARKGSRVVAGLKGDEVLLRDAESGELSFTWLYPGTPNSGTEPQISLKMDSTEAKKGEAQALWDALLDSMRPAWK